MERVLGDKNMAAALIYRYRTMHYGRLIRFE